MKSIACMLPLILMASTASGSMFESANELLIGTKGEVVRYFDWFFIWVASAALFLVTALGFFPRANVRLGPADESPEFSRFSWLAMLFSAGLASGLLYWAVAEPIIHYQGNPLLEAAGGGPDAAAASALRITVFHWGLHGWALYVLGGLAIAISSYRHGRPLTIRSALYPILGDRWIDRWPGRLADLIALVGTVFGVATSIGLSAAALNATLFAGFGLPVNSTMQIAIVFSVCGLGVVSAMSGLARGIRRLSEVNIWVSIVFLLAVLALGPTLHLVAMIGFAAFDYVLTVVPLGLWIGSTEPEKQWQAAWTVFYWGWWLAWMPFVSLFIARISKGRTVREFVVFVMGAPTIVILVWMVILGGTALDQEMANPGSLSVAVNQDYSLGIVKLLENVATGEVVINDNYFCRYNDN
ncbi:MAG: BCCT family transporter [bacterium]|nr:BCCT family transporter [bacterium]